MTQKLLEYKRLNCIALSGIRYRSNNRTLEYSNYKIIVPWYTLHIRQATENLYKSSSNRIPKDLAIGAQCAVKVSLTSYLIQAFCAICNKFKSHLMPTP